MFNKALIKQNYFSEEWCDSLNKKALQQPSYRPPHAGEPGALRNCEIRSISIQNKPLFHDCLNLVYDHLDYFDINISPKIEKDSFVHISYGPGDYLKSHFDTLTEVSYADGPFNKNINRKLSVIIMLSHRSEYTGGNFSFGWGAGQRHDPSKDEITGKGTIAIFTSFTRHQVTPITSGMRRILLFWVLGPQWR